MTPTAASSILYLPFQYASVIIAAYLFTASDLGWLGYPGALSWPAKIGLALSVGVLGGTGTPRMGWGTRRTPGTLAVQDRAGPDLLRALLASSTTPATTSGSPPPEDPALGALRRVVLGVPAAQHSWQRPLVTGCLEAARIRRLGRSPWDPRTWLSNDVLNAWLMSVVLGC